MWESVLFAVSNTIRSMSKVPTVPVRYLLYKCSAFWKFVKRLDTRL
jgi:hypothetical protein